MQGSLGRIERPLRPTWASCNATACCQPASTSEGSASGSANLSLLWVIARSASGDDLVETQAVSWVRSSALQGRCSGQGGRAARRAAGQRRGGQRELGQLLAMGLQQPGMVEERTDQQGLPRRAAAATASGKLVAAHGEPCRARQRAAGRPAATVRRPRSRTRQSSWVLSRRLPAKRASRRPLEPAICRISLRFLAHRVSRSSRSYWLRTPGSAMRATRRLEARLQGRALLGRDGGLALLLLALDQHVERARSWLSRISWKAAAPCWRTRSSGSRPSGRKANCTLKPGFRCGSTVSTARKAARRPAAVAVEAQDRLGRHAPQQPDLVLGQRRAERRHGLREARLGQGDDVHVAFDDDRSGPCRAPRRGRRGRCKDAALMEERRLRRVQVFGGGIRIQRPPAEGDDAALEIADRKHDAMPEPVVGDGDVVARDQHARGHHVGCREAGFGQVLLQRRPAVGRVAQAEAGDGLGASSPRSVEVAARLRAGGPGELLLEKTRRRLQQRVAAVCVRPPASASRGPAFGMGTPASSASRSTASGKLRPSVSIRNLKMSPCSPDEKSNTSPSGR